MRRIIVVLIALGLTAGIGYWWYGSQQSPGKDKGKMMRRMPTPSVRVALVEQQDVPVYIQAIGTVRPSQEAAVRSQVTGRLMQLHFQEGSYVEKGQLLATIDVSQHEANLKQYEGELASARAQLKNAETILARYKTLIGQNALSRQNYDTQVQLVEQYRGSIRVTQGRIEATRVNIDYGRITAPISGYTGIRGHDVGNLIAANADTPIVTISQSHPATVLFSVPENAAGRVIGAARRGRALTVMAFDQSRHDLLATGRTVAIDHAIDTATGTLRVKSEFENAENHLYPNQSVDVKVLVRTMKDALVVPVTAIQTGTAGSYVFTIDANNVAHRHDVKTARGVDSKFAVITQGIEKGARVVTTGVDSLSEGSKVNIVEALNVDISSLNSPRKRRPRGRRPEGQAPGAAGAPADRERTGARS